MENGLSVSDIDSITEGTTIQARTRRGGSEWHRPQMITEITCRDYGMVGVHIDYDGDGVFTQIFAGDTNVRIVR